MFSIPRFSRQTRALMLLGICLLILSVIPAQRAHALTIPQEVDNTLEEFSRGGFQRSSLAGTKVDPAAPDPAPKPKVTDKEGAVQLLPVGILKNWINPNFLLPNPLMDMGTVAIGRNIFVLGGSAKIGNNPELTKDVWSLQINQETGVPKDTGTPESWFNETQDLPAVQTSITPGYTTPYAPRSKMAITAVTTGLDSGYIYVIGGNVQSGTGSASGFDISSFAVNIATVSGGHITSWALGQRVPTDPDLGDVGMLGATALSFTSGSNTYIYVFGGLQRYQEDQNSVDVPSRRVFYARVGSGGQLVKPSGGTGSDPVWAELPPIIDIVSPAGLWDAAGVVDHFDVGGGVGGDVLFLMGGQTDVNNYNSRVFRATINSSNGSLTWQTDPTPPTLPEKRTRMAAVQVNGNLYVTGGQAVSGITLGRPQKEILTTYVEDDLTLAILGENGSSNFLRTTPPPLPLPRAGHGSVVIQSTPTVAEPNSAFVYVIAGQGDDGDTDTTDDQGSKTLIYGKVGKSENTEETGFATSGWFYSAAHSTAENFNGEQVQEIHWTTDIDRTKGDLDIRIQYRLSSEDNCDAPGAFDNAQWSPELDSSPNDGFFSIHSGNKFDLAEPITAHCFQYRAKLITTNNKATPALLNVSILVKIPGSPDLTVKEVKDQRGNDGEILTGLFVTIQNHNENQPVTLAADAAGPGWFYVDLCVFGPGEPIVPPTLPMSDQNPQCSDAYAEINKNVMGVDVIFSVTQWCKTRPENECLPIDVLSLFDKPGDFTVIVAVDTYDYVLEEPTSPAEQNNVTTQPYTVITVHADPDDPTKPNVGHRINLAIIRR